MILKPDAKIAEASNFGELERAFYKKSRNTFVSFLGGEENNSQKFYGLLNSMEMEIRLASHRGTYQLSVLSCRQIKTLCSFSVLTNFSLNFNLPRQIESLFIFSGLTSFSLNFNLSRQIKNLFVFSGLTSFSLNSIPIFLAK